MQHDIAPAQPPAIRAIGKGDTLHASPRPSERMSIGHQIQRRETAGSWPRHGPRLVEHDRSRRAVDPKTQITNVFESFVAAPGLELGRRQPAARVAFSHRGKGRDFGEIDDVPELDPVAHDREFAEMIDRKIAEWVGGRGKSRAEHPTKEHRQGAKHTKNDGVPFHARHQCLQELLP